MLKLNNNIVAPKILSKIVEKDSGFKLVRSSDYCCFLTSIVGDNRKIVMVDCNNNKFSVSEMYVNERNLSEIKVVLDNGNEWIFTIDDVDDYRLQAPFMRFGVKTDRGSYMFNFSPESRN